MKTANVLVTLGSSSPDAWGRAIAPLLMEVGARWPGTHLCTAVTSPSIRRALNSRGEKALPLEEALYRLAGEGVGQVRLCAAHLIRSENYEKVCVQAERARERFSALALSRPLLAEAEDRRRVVRILDRRFPPSKRQAVLLIHHGSGGSRGAVYSSMESICREEGRGDFYVAAAEEAPDQSGLISRLKQAAAERVVLVPLMLTAGTHAARELDGARRGSWCERLERAGFSAETFFHGLGEYPEVRRLYLEHFAQAPYL